MVKFSDLYPLSIGGGSANIAGFQWEEKKADFIAEANKAYYIDTALGNILKTLPSSPSNGDEIGLLLIGANKVNITTTDKIKGALLATDYAKQVATNYLLIILTYIDGTTGWDWNPRYDSTISDSYLGLADPLSANVVLFLKGDGEDNSTSIVDSSASPKTITRVGSTAIRTAQKKYGTSSIFFDGSGSYLKTPYSMPTNCTVEAWLFTTETTTDRDDGIFAFHTNNDLPGADTLVSLHLSPGGLGLRTPTGYQFITTAIPANTWNHVALIKAQSVFNIYLNGVLVGTKTDASSLSGVSHLFIGAYYSSVYCWKGYKDSIRATNAIRYTTDFNPENDTFLNI